MSSAWSCPHEHQGGCRRRNAQHCEAGAAGCVLEEVLQRSAKVVARSEEQNATEQRGPNDSESSR